MLLHLNYENPQSKDIDAIVKCLKNDGVIIYPTDTVYSIGCDITSQKAIEKLARLKNIKPEKANFSFVCSDLSHLANYCRPISNTVFRIIKKALPGPYTFILEANNNVPKLLKQNKKTVGIRVPDNPICLAIVKELGNPIISTSLHNTDDEIAEYFSDPEVIHAEYESKVDMVIDGGFGNLYASTVLDCSSDEIVVLREGLGSLDILD
ncbi:MAG: threonylcarbamoyl-AMP synthase [Bacteroidia bacterium]|nr:threonylcarbamoyl-AMP synthase [Bacteroidia bacterium]